MSNPPIAEVSYLATGERLHAELGASSAHQWSECTASIAAQRGRSRPSTTYSQWGTVNHFLAATSLQENKEPEDYRGWTVFVKEGRDHDEWMKPPTRAEYADLDSFTYCMEVDDEHIDCATYYTGLMRSIANETNGELYAEIRVPVAHITGEYAIDSNGNFILDAKGRKIPARGTADCVIPIVQARELVVGDLKAGEGVVVDAFYTEVEVDNESGELVDVAKPNKQLAMYASGALRKFRKLGTDGVIVKWETVRLMIIQPRLNRVSEHVFTVDEIEAQCKYLSAKAEETRTNPVFKPGYKTCQFCSASGECEAQARAVVKALDSDFEDFESVKQPLAVPDELSRLDEAYALIPFIRSWCDAVAGRMHMTLSQTGPTARFKLVQGDKGHRAFKSVDDFLSDYVDGIALTDDEIYERKVLSPAKLEKYLKQKKRKDLWESINKDHIIQPPAKLVVAPIDDPREAIQASNDSIEDLGDDGTGTGGATTDEDFSPD
jgi:hypothetical protein